MSFYYIPYKHNQPNYSSMCYQFLSIQDIHGMDE